MLTSVNGARHAGEWYASALASGTTPPIAANSFENKLLSVIAETLERAAENIGSTEAAASQVLFQNEMVESTKSQILDSYASPADDQAAASGSHGTTLESTASAAAAATRTDPSTSVSGDTTASTEPEALAKLNTALEAAGHKPEDYNLIYEDQTVWYPDGTYQNRIIRATFAGGYQESYGADLTNESPSATVLSIEHTLRDIAAGDCS